MAVRMQEERGCARVCFDADCWHGSGRQPKFVYCRNHWRRADVAPIPGISITRLPARADDVSDHLVQRACDAHTASNAIVLPGFIA